MDAPGPVCACGNPLVPVAADARFHEYLCVECGFVAVPAGTADARLRRTLRVARAGLPSRYVDARVPATEDNLAARRALRAFAVGELRGVTLIGPVGVGKTHLLARCAVHAIAYRDVACLYVPYATLREAIRDPARGNEYERYRRTAILIVDDVGGEQATPWTTERFCALLDDRYRYLRPLLAATNVPADRLPDTLGERAASRLLALAPPVPIGGPDHRKAAA